MVSFFLLFRLSPLWGLLGAFSLPLPCYSLPHPGAAVPRFHAVLKSKEVNWRKGPGPEHPIVWVYRYPGWPVIILRQWDHWLYIQDADGATGWVHTSLLRFKRHLLIIRDWCPLHMSPEKNSSIVAYLRTGVVGTFLQEKNGWFLLSPLNGKARGWVQKSAVWDPHAPSSQKPGHAKNSLPPTHNTSTGLKNSS